MPQELPVDHWLRWHDAYADPSSSHSQRLRAVQAQIRAALDRAAPGSIQVLSLCAGQGHDILGALSDHRRASDVRARLIELDPHNAQAARAAAAERGLGEQIEVVEADAGVTDPSVGATPADLLLLVGIFGNISDADVKRTMLAVPTLCRSGGTVIWTRHRRPPDLTPAIRAWLAEAGCEEVNFTAPDGELFSIGVARFQGDPAPLEAGRRLFTFDRTAS
jgi:hypothetical protein